MVELCPEGTTATASCAALPVAAWAPGYMARTVRLSFKRRRWLTMRIYRRSLQWPMYGAEPSRTQAQTGIDVRPPFRLAWTRSAGALVEFPAVVYEGVAYVTNYRGVIRAISMRTGKVAWTRRTPNGKMAASPAVWGERLVAHGMDGHVWVLNRSNGRSLWRYRIGSPIESSPVVRDGIDFFGAWDGNVYALDLRRRRLVWRYRSDYKITSSAALAGASLYIGDYGGRLLALTVAGGHLRFARSVDGRVYGTPAAWGGRVYFGSYDGRLYSVAARTGRVLWTVGVGGPVSGAAVVVAGVAYAGSTANRIVGADARSGRVVLRFPHGEYVPVSGNGGRLLLHGYSRLYAVERRR